MSRRPSPPAARPPERTRDVRLALVLVLVLLAHDLREAFLSEAEPPPPLALPTWRVDVNLASPGELAALPGVGPLLAERIVASRAAGPFATVDDLTRVPGIGPSVLSRLRPYALCESGRMNRGR